MPTDYLKDLMTKVKASKRKPGEAETAAQSSKQAAVKKALPEEKGAAAEEILRAMRQSSTIPAKESEAGEAAVPVGEAMQLIEGQKSQVEKELEETKAKIEVASYGDVRIFRLPDKPMLYYFVPVPKAAASERTIINTLKEAATRLISIQPYRIRDQAQRRIIYKQKIEEILKASPELKIPRGRFDFYIDAVVREMVGYGLIDQLVQDDRLEEIMIIGPKKPVFVFHRDFEMMATNIEFFSDDEVQDLINRIAREVGRRVDLSAPLLDARLPDGSRVNATIPPASVSGSTLTIRKFREDPYSIVDLVNFGTINAEVAAFLWLCVEGMSVRPANVLISGGTGSGKTTLLNVLASFIPENERVITIEDTAELNLPLNHWIRLEAKPPGLEGKGELTMDILTKNSLRMRPDRIIVGEIRHAEAFSLFTAMNTGHDGSLGSVHANSAQETLVRVTSPPMNVPPLMLSGLDFVIIEHRLHDRQKGTIRRVTEISEVSGVLQGKAQTQELFKWNPVDDSFERTSVPSAYLKMLGDFSGLKKKQLEDEISERERFLKELVKLGIRSMPDVSVKFQAFIDGRSKK